MTLSILEPAVAQASRPRIRIIKKVRRVSRRAFLAVSASTLFMARARGQETSPRRSLGEHLGAAGAALVLRHIGRKDAIRSRLHEALDHASRHPSHATAVSALRQSFAALSKAEAAARTPDMQLAVQELVGQLILDAPAFLGEAETATIESQAGQAGRLVRTTVDVDGRVLDVNIGERLAHISLSSPASPLRIIRVTETPGRALSVGRNLDAHGHRERLESTPVGRAGAILRLDRHYERKPGQAAPIAVTEERYFVDPSGRLQPQGLHVLESGARPPGSATPILKEIRHWNLRTDKVTTRHVYGDRSTH